LEVGDASQEAVFTLFFRQQSSFPAAFTIACGLSGIIEYMNHFHSTLRTWIIWAA